MFDEQAQEVIKINKICIKNYCKETVGRDIHIASGIEIIAGSVLDNLCEGEKTRERLQQLDSLLEIFELKFLEKCFDKKIDSQKIKYDLEFDTLIVLKMNVIRAILKSPKLLVLIDSYGLTKRNGDKSIIQILENLDITTLIVSIKQGDQMQLKSYEMLKKDPSFKKLMLLVLVGIFGVGIVLAMIPWQQTVDGFGEVTTLSPSDRQQNISAPIGGRLGKWYVFRAKALKKVIQ